VFQVVDVAHGAEGFLAIKHVPEAPLPELWYLPSSSSAQSARQIGDVHCRDAALSYDGTRVACADATGLGIRALDGTEVSHVSVTAGNAGWPRWSPDGRHVAFTVNRVPPQQEVVRSIWRVNVDGSDLAEMFPRLNGLGSTCFGSWSPSGRRFVFELWREHRGEIWMADAGDEAWSRGHEPVLLATGETSFSAPTFAGDDETIVATGIYDDGELMTLDEHAHVWTKSPSPIKGLWIEYSPDEARVAYSGFPDRRLWVAMADGSQARAYTRPGALTDSPHWSPDRKWLAFRGNLEGGQSKIFVMPATGGAPVAISTDDREQGVPTWSDDSRRIAFGDVWPEWGYPRGQETVRIYDRVTQQTTTVPGSEGRWSPRWSPDGRSLLALTMTSHALAIYDFRWERWREFAKILAHDAEWSHDSSAVFYHPQGGDGATLRRLTLATGTDSVVTADTPPHLFEWLGLAPGDIPTVFRHLGKLEIYRLKVK